MARTEEQIQNDLIASIETTDPTIDTAQGPVPDLFIRPQAGQLAISSQEAEDLRTLFTIQFPDSATDAEIQTALGNYGSAPGEGEKSSHVQYFMRFTRPTEDIVIPAGSLVSNSDGSLVYTVVSGGTISFNTADTFYNSTRNTYELGLLVEATGTGSEYELPKLRVNSLLSPVTGIDATENRVKSLGGLPQEDVASQADRLRESLKGINLGAPGGIKNKIMGSLASSVTDVAVVQPFEKEFRRITDGAALDVYMIGSSAEIFTQSNTAIFGQTEIILTKVPAINVQSVSVNGVAGAVGFTLVPDMSPETGKSLQAVDAVVLDTPLLAGDSVEIQYEYNKVPEDAYEITFSSGEDFLFNTDILLRSAFDIYPRVEGDVRILPSYRAQDVEEAILEFNTEYFNLTTFVTTVYPEQYRQQLLLSVQGIQQFRITMFRRNTGALSDIEPIVLTRNEKLTFNTDLVIIAVIQ